MSKTCIMLHMSSRYKQAYVEMYEQNKELFDSFKKVHDGFIKNPNDFQFRFNKLGKKILEIVRDHEQKLCGKTERGVYSKFAGNLSDRFWGEIRLHYPKIDFVGIKVS